MRGLSRHRDSPTPSRNRRRCRTSGSDSTSTRPHQGLFRSSSGKFRLPSRSHPSADLHRRDRVDRGPGSGIGWSKKEVLGTTERVSVHPPRLGRTPRVTSVWRWVGVTRPPGRPTYRPHYDPPLGPSLLLPSVLVRSRVYPSTQLEGTGVPTRGNRGLSRQNAFWTSQPNTSSHIRSGVARDGADRGPDRGNRYLRKQTSST